MGGAFYCSLCNRGTGPYLLLNVTTCAPRAIAFKTERHNGKVQVIQHPFSSRELFQKHLIFFRQCQDMNMFNRFVQNFKQTLISQ